MLRFWFECFGKGEMYLQFMLFHKCKRNCDKTCLDFFRSISNIICAAYVIVKKPRVMNYLFVA
jgi:hypothetical protein